MITISVHLLSLVFARTSVSVYRAKVQSVYDKILVATIKFLLSRDSAVGLSPTGAHHWLWVINGVTNHRALRKTNKDSDRIANCIVN